MRSTRASRSSVDAELGLRVIETNRTQLVATPSDEPVTPEGSPELGAAADEIPARRRARIRHLPLTRITQALAGAIVFGAAELAGVRRPAETPGRLIEAVRPELAVAGATSLRRGGDVPRRDRRRARKRWLGN
jgi:hypothetical protein